MNKSLAIFGASVLGLVTGVAVINIVDDQTHIISGVQAEPVEVKSAPVPVTNPGDDVVNITTTDGKTFTAMRKNVSCKTTTLYADFPVEEQEQLRKCSAHGVMTDLAGVKKHYSEENEICFIKKGYGNWQILDNWLGNYSGMACSAAIEFGKS